MNLNNSLYEKLETLGRRKLSNTFYMRDFLYSEISNANEIPNYPNDPELAVENGKVLCERLLEPLQDAFGRIHIRSGYRSPDVNDFGNKNSFNCGSNERNYGGHIWDIPNSEFGNGAMACVVIPAIAKLSEDNPGIWKELGYWIHDHLPAYSTVWFFKNLFAFNIGWCSSAPKLIRKQGVATIYNESDAAQVKVDKFGAAMYPNVLAQLSKTR